MEDALEEVLRELMAERPPLSEHDIRRHADAIGETLGVSPTRVRQIVDRLLQRR